MNLNRNLKISSGKAGTNHSPSQIVLFVDTFVLKATILCRFYESGCFEGSLAEIIGVIEPFQGSEFLKWKVYSSQDLELQKLAKPKKTGTATGFWGKAL